MTEDGVVWVLSSLMAEMCEEPEAFPNWKDEARRLIIRMCKVNGGVEHGRLL